MEFHIPIHSSVKDYMINKTFNEQLHKDNDRQAKDVMIGYFRGRCMAVEENDN